MIDINDPLLVTGIGTMLMVTLAHAIRNLWKKTLQDSIELKDDKSHSDLINTLLAERVTHNQDLLNCYEKYNKLVSEYGEILATTREARREIEALRVEVRALKEDIATQQVSYSKQVKDMEVKLDEALKEKHLLFTENTKLKEQLQNVANYTK